MFIDDLVSQQAGSVCGRVQGHIIYCQRVRNILSGSHLFWNHVQPQISIEHSFPFWGPGLFNYVFVNGVGPDIQVK